MRELADIWSAIATLKEARQMVYEEARGTADPRYTWWKNTEHTVKRAEEAYRKLSEQRR